MVLYCKVMGVYVNLGKTPAKSVLIIKIYVLQQDANMEM